MLQIFYANQMEHLVEQLVDQIDAQRQLSPFGIFEPVVILVPHERMGDYLNMALAQYTGISANLNFKSATTFWTDALASMGCRLIDGALLRAMIVEILQDTSWVEGHTSLGPVRRFLGNNEDADFYERRVFQFASELADRFDAYTKTRAAMLRGWLEGELFFEDSAQTSIELWQCAIWRRLFEPRTGWRARQGFERQWILPHELPSMVEQGQVKLPTILHAMDLMSLDPTGYALLEASARRTVVFGYSLNPCSAFWEDMRFGRQEDNLNDLFSSSSVDAGAVDYQGDDRFWREELNAPILLRLWGFCGAQHLRVISQMDQLESIDLYDETHQDHLLARIKRDVLEMVRPPGPHDSADPSIDVLAAPSMKREVEVVASEIWALLDENARMREEDPSVEVLRLSDIAVLLPPDQKNVYQTHIQAVFPNTRELAFNMVDIDAMKVSRAMEAVHLLLSLPFGQFKRQELLRLLTHPNVMGRFPNIDPDKWLAWCDSLKILHGADHKDHADTYIEGELFHWDQGLKRLVLGAFMTGQQARDRRVFHLGRRHYLPFELSPGEQQSASRLVLMARSLIEDARFCREAKMSLTQWSDFFCRMTSVYLVAAGVDDEFQLQRCRTQLSTLRDLDITGRQISYRRAFELAMDTLSSLEMQRGQFLLEGVNVAQLMSHRPIPYKVIFVLGLGEGLYPESETRYPEDLRFATDREGAPILPGVIMADMTERDRQKFAMLELMMCASQKLVFSYVDRDMRSGEAREPSTIISELLFALEEDYIATPTELITHHELRRFHQRYFPHLFEADQSALNVTPSMQPEARTEASVLALREDLQAFCQSHQQPFPSVEVLQYGLNQQNWQALQSGLRVLTLPDTRRWFEDRPILRLTTHDIRSFLECPLQGSAKFLLKLGEDDGEDVLLEESELFETHIRARMVLLHDVFHEHVSALQQAENASELGTIYDARARYFELAGLVPTGPFYRAARQKHLRTLITWCDNFERLGLGQAPKMEVHHFGRTVDRAHIDVASEPIVLDVALPGLSTDKVQVEISGRLDAYMPEHQASHIANPTEQIWSLSRKYFMRGFLDQVLLSAHGESFSEPWRVFINPGEEVERYKQKHCVRKFEPLTPSESKHYLSNIIQDMLTRVHAYYLPIEVAFEHLEKEEPIALVAEKKRQNAWSTTSADFGPVRDPKRFETPEDAEQIIQRRYGPFFDRLITGGKRR